MPSEPPFVDLSSEARSITRRPVTVRNVLRVQNVGRKVLYFGDPGVDLRLYGRPLDPGVTIDFFDPWPELVIATGGGRGRARFACGRRASWG